LHGHRIEHLVAVLSQWPQRAAAVGTGAVAGSGLDPLFLAWQMGRQRADRRWPVSLSGICLARSNDDGFSFEFFQRQF
jgi:hypothetical protein